MPLELINFRNNDEAIGINYEVAVINRNQQYRDFKTGKKMKGVGNIYFCHDGKLDKHSKFFCGRKFKQI